jgi:GNAT superfamily N-acetyltransferase
MTAITSTTSTSRTGTTTRTPVPGAGQARARSVVVGRAAAERRSDLSTVLGAAFLDDPVFAWIVEDRRHLEATIVPVFEAFVAAFARHDESWLAVGGGVPAGGALWAPPGVEAVHPDDDDALTERLVELMGPHVERLGICMERLQAAHPTEPAWYLNFLGAAPPWQGQGVGSQLLAAVLDRADAAGEPAYLEATTLRNRALYERHGFRCTRDITLPGGPTLYAMWRAPADQGR